MGAKPTPILVLWSKPTGSPRPAPRRSPRARCGSHHEVDRVDGCDHRRTTSADRSAVLRGVTVVRHPLRPSGAGPAAPVAASPRRGRRDHVRVAIAASTGGPAALAEVMAGMGGIQAPVLMVQHIHADFIDGLVDLDGTHRDIPSMSGVRGCGSPRGAVYISPGDVHLKVDKALRAVLDPLPETAIARRPTSSSSRWPSVGAEATRPAHRDGRPTGRRASWRSPGRGSHHRPGPGDERGVRHAEGSTAGGSRAARASAQRDRPGARDGQRSSPAVTAADPAAMRSTASQYCWPPRSGFASIVDPGRLSRCVLDDAAATRWSPIYIKVLEKSEPASMQTLLDRVTVQETRSS